MSAVVVIADDRYGAYDEERAVLEPLGTRIELYRSTDPSGAAAAFASADAIIVNLLPMDAALIEALPRCRVISRYGVGFDNVDVEAATRRGIWVANVSDYYFEDVSDHALGLLLGCIRKIAYKDRGVRAGRWNLHRDQPAWRIAGRTLGIVGYGKAARCLHRKVAGFGLGRVLVHDPLVPAAAITAAGAEPSDLASLLQQSDYVSLHVPLMPSTRHMIGATEIARMKPTALLVNTARGPIVDEAALAAALRDGRIAGAGLDVFESEPLAAGSPLRDLDNVILTDHAGWYSEESVVELKTKAARNVAAVLAGNPPPYPVNADGMARRVKG